MSSFLSFANNRLKHFRESEDEDADSSMISRTYSVLKQFILFDLQHQMKLSKYGNEFFHLKVPLFDSQSKRVRTQLHWITN